MYSHIEPVIESNGDSVDVTYPKIKHSNINKYFNGNYRVLLLRPVHTFNRNVWIAEIKAQIGMDYDLLSFAGFALNKNIQNKKSYNCAELVLMADKQAGMLVKRELKFITPQSYFEYAIAGEFEMVFWRDCPVMNDFKILTGGT
jgi:hypothetical protein